MAYDENLALRVSAVLVDLPGLTEKKMFGGVSLVLGTLGREGLDV